MAHALLVCLPSQQLAACNSLDECVQTSHKNDKPKQTYHVTCPQKGQTAQVQTLIFLSGVTFKDLTTSLTGGSEEDEGTKTAKLGVDTSILSTKPNPVLSQETFEH